MRKLLAALLLAASPALAQTNGWQEIQNGWSEIQTVPAAPGSTHVAATDVTTFTGALVAKNLTATGLATPGAITVAPTLTKVGSITTVAGASLVDGDYFAIKYGPGLTVPIEFDATPGNGTTGGRVPLVFAAGDTADQIRDAIITLLNTAAPTALTASSGGAATVAIVLDVPGAVGDTSTENVTDAGFAVTGFVNPTAVTTVTYQLVACLADGTCTQAGADSTTTVSTATLSASNFLRLSWSAVPGTALYKVYRKVAPTSPATVGIVYSGTALTVDDTGLAGGGETAPTVDGTGRITSDALTPGGVAIVGAGGRVETDAGLTYDAATDTLTAGRVLSGIGTTVAPGIAFAAYPTTGFVGGASFMDFSINTGTYMRLSAAKGATLAQISLGLGGATENYFRNGGGDGVLQFGAANSATPVAQTDRAQGGAGTNIAGQRRNRQGSLATGTADSGAIVDQTGYTAGATTTQHVYSDRSGLFARWTALTAGAATGFATLTYAASTSIGAEFFVTIRAGDGTNRQGMSYRVAVNSVRDAAGNTQSVPAVIGTPPVAAGSGTLTCTFDVAEGAGAVTLRANCASSLTETFLDANFQTIANGPGLTVAAL